MELDRHFPRYREFDPIVPVWCVTPGDGRCIHRFFDTSPISPSGRYLAVFRMPFEDRQPTAGEAGQIVLVDLDKGSERVLAETCGWEQQMGANLNWGASDQELFFNDVDTTDWKPFAWKLNPVSGARQKLNGPVYHASPDGRWLIAANPTTMRKTQPGYGVVIPDAEVRWNTGAADDDGFYLTDTQSGASRLLLSIRTMLETANPQVSIQNAGQVEIYGFHSKFNPQGDRLMLSLRWFPAGQMPRFDMFKLAFQEVRYAWITLSLDEKGHPSQLACAVGPEQWEKGGHHATWFPDGERISMNLDINREGCLRLVQVNADGSGLHPIHPDVIGSGHPTVHPDGRHILTDTYTNEAIAYGDGTIPLRWIDLQTGSEQVLLRINTLQPHPQAVLRIDPHPAWDRSWRYVTFNAYTGGTRRVFIADMEKMLSATSGT